MHYLGIIHQERGEYDKAKEQFIKSLEIKKELSDKAGIAITLDQLGSLYDKTEDYLNAIKCYLISVRLFEYLKSSYVKAVNENLDIVKQKIGDAKFNEYIKEAERTLS